MIPSSYPFYGQSIGVLVFSGTAPRVPGDPGCADTFSYPVRYEVVPGGFMDLVEGSPAVENAIRDAGQRLVDAGVRGIVADCGLMSRYQRLAADWGVPFVGASLCLVPLLWRMFGERGHIGIITGHSALLRPAHLAASGCTAEIALAIQGMEEEPHFSEVVIGGGHALDVERMERDVCAAGQKLAARTPDLAAVILECSNLGTYSYALQELLGVPVFDTVCAANLLHAGLCPTRYRQAGA